MNCSIWQTKNYNYFQKDTSKYHSLSFINKTQEEWPQSLKDYIKNSYDLAIQRDCSFEKSFDTRLETGTLNAVDRHMITSLSTKKLHEVYFFWMNNNLLGPNLANLQKYTLEMTDNL